MKARNTLVNFSEKPQLKINSRETNTQISIHTESNKDQRYHCKWGIAIFTWKPGKSFEITFTVILTSNLKIYESKFFLKRLKKGSTTSSRYFGDFFVPFLNKKKSDKSHCTPIPSPLTFFTLWFILVLLSSAPPQPLVCPFIILIGDVSSKAQWLLSQIFKLTEISHLPKPFKIILIWESNFC